jgi:hypothetical protein
MRRRMRRRGLCWLGIGRLVRRWDCGRVRKGGGKRLFWMWVAAVLSFGLEGSRWATWRFGTLGSFCIDKWDGGLILHV